MSSGDGLISGFYATTGGQVGIAINAFLFIPFPQGGIIMQDSAGAYWLLQIATDGSLSTTSYTP